MPGIVCLICLNLIKQFPTTNSPKLSARMITLSQTVFINTKFFFALQTGISDQKHDFFQFFQLKETVIK